MEIHDQLSAAIIRGDRQRVNTLAPQYTNWGSQEAMVLLETAILYQHEEILRSLLPYAPNINLPVNVHSQNTLVHITILANQLWALRVLIEHGANVNILNVEGESPLAVAVDEDNINAIDVLMGSKKVGMQNTDDLHASPLTVAVTRVIWNGQAMVMRGGIVNDQLVGVRVMHVLTTHAYLFRLDVLEHNLGQIRAYEHAPWVARDLFKEDIAALQKQITLTVRSTIDPKHPSEKMRH